MLGLEVRDLPAWERLATGVLGLAAERGADGSLSLRMDERRRRIALHPGTRDDLAYLGWDVAGAAGLAALAARLAGAGVDVATGDAGLCAERGVDALVWCLDPNGIRNEFATGAALAAEPFRSPRALSGFVAGDAGVGHVVITVDDEPATLHFYRDLVGLRISDFIDFEREPGVPVRMTFLHCNARHHSLAFVRRPGSPRRLSHLMLETCSIDDVGTTLTLCEREDVPIAMSLGRHTNDDMFSFYLATPSGFNIEFGFGGKSIDDATWDVRHYDAASVWGHRRAPAPSVERARQPEGMIR
jgi:2,3-dihydroxybiphenyl 1,2-dioxygenase